MVVELAWRGRVTNEDLNALHAEGFDHAPFDDDWETQPDRHSLGWVVARDHDGRLVGFVNVAWDGGVHAFLLDTLVTVSYRGGGIGRSLVQGAADGAAEAGCEWLHVDWDGELGRFYLDSCGFVATSAGLLRLR